MVVDMFPGLGMYCLYTAPVQHIGNGRLVSG